MGVALTAKWLGMRRTLQASQKLGTREERARRGRLELPQVYRVTLELLDILSTFGATNYIWTVENGDLHTCRQRLDEVSKREQLGDREQVELQLIRTFLARLEQLLSTKRRVRVVAEPLDS